ncbi:MAG: hypothetical protein KBD51_01955 [Candidatus Levybacteria bacterium]|nr:hypothetical protein [Candidatus Levybacteria bacterium]
MNAMEPVPPIAQPDAQPATPARGPIARVKGAVGGFFAGGGPDASSQVMVTNPPGEIAPATPGLQPRPDTTPAAVVPSPWANPDAAAAAVPPSLASIAEPTFGAAPVAEPAAVVPTLPEDPFAPKATIERAPITIPEPIATAAPEPTVTPDPLTSPTVEPAPIAPTLPSDPFAPKATTEPVAPAPVEPAPVIPIPEPTVVASPVWEQNPTDSGTDSIVVDPDMRTSSTPSVEPTTGATTPEDTSAVASEEATPEPPMFRKVVDGDLISYEFTPEGRDKMMAAFAKAVDSGAFNDLAGMFASGQGSEPEAQNTEATAPTPPTESLPATPTTELPPPPTTSASPTLPGTI